METLADVAEHRDALWNQVWMLTQFLVSAFPDEWREGETACKTAIVLLGRYKRSREAAPEMPR